MSTELRFCIYCRSEKPIADFSLEHIFPDSLGGSQCNDLFKTKHVCQRCNNLCGLFVDGLFLKNFFFQNDKAEDSLKYIDFENGSILPLNYMGFLESIETPENEVCELWLGPCGATIYHFHEKYDERFIAYAGGNPIKSKRNPGYVIIFGTTENENWMKTILLSFGNHFKYVKRISGNIGIADNKTKSIFFHEPNSEELKVIEKLKVLSGKEHKAHSVIQIGFEYRFLAKLALGVGFNIFGNQYLETPYSQILKKALWKTDFNNWEQVGIKLTGFIAQNEKLKEIIPWEGGHTILIMSVGSYLVLSVWFFGKTHLQVAISDEPELIEKHADYKNGIIFILIPQKNKQVGPLCFGNYLAYKQGVQQNSELDEIASWKVDLKNLPPF